MFKKFLGTLLIVPCVSSSLCYSMESQSSPVIDIQSSNVSSVDKNFLLEIFKLKNKTFCSYFSEPTEEEIEKDAKRDIEYNLKKFGEKNYKFHISFIKDDENKPICCAIFEQYDDGDIKLNFLFSAEQKQRKGYGTRMVNYIRSLVPKGSAIRLNATINSIDFYKKTGFTQLDFYGKRGLYPFIWINENSRKYSA